MRPSAHLSSQKYQKSDFFRSEFGLYFDPFSGWALSRHVILNFAGEFMRNIRPVLFVAIFSLLVALSQTQPMFAAAARGTTARITQSIDDTQTITLGRNTHPDANAKNDRGRVSDNWDADHMLIVLQRSPEKERELVRYIDSLNDRKSPNFHHWLNAEEFGAQYGVAQEDIDKVTGWLESQRFRINQVYASRMMIDFSGTAGSIRNAFHTEIHQLDVKGQMHFSNMSNPQIPAALAPAIKWDILAERFQAGAHVQVGEGLYVLQLRPVTADAPTEPGNCYAITPYDNAAIYDLYPLWNNGISGQGQTIALVEDTDTYGATNYATDWNTYRTTFGLASAFPSGNYIQTHPGGCADPGTNGDDGEAAIDVEVASAIAPSATIELISCPIGGFTFGGVLALTNMVNAAGPYPGVVSMSYGLCEAGTGNGATAYFYSAFQQAASEGISAFASSGDGGPSGCSTLFGDPYALTSLSITGWGESPYNVSVGGTDFEDTFNSKIANTSEGGTTIPLTTYWGANNANFGSALSYIPEIPWNDACASVLISDVARSSFVTYGSTGTCNVSPWNTTSGYLSAGAGAGGPSNCATGNGGATTTSGAVSDAYCQGYPKPSYQSGAGLLNGQAVYGQPSDGVRDIPDVSMFAANGVWGHFETVCWSDPSQTSGGAVSCSGAPSTWAGFGGTSVAAPTMAAIQSLVNQKSGQNWGNPNPIYYQLAQNQYGSTAGGFTGSLCNSSRPGGPVAGCVFNDVTQGDIDLACEDNGTAVEQHCYKPSGTFGVTSTDVIAGTQIISGGVGYTSNPTCTVAGPSNNNPYKSPTGTTLWAGGTQATCTATFNSGSTTAAYTIKFVATGATINTDYPNQLGFTIGGVTYTFVSSLTGAPANSVLLVTTGSTSAQETANAKNLEAAINATSSQCNASPCFGTGTVANPLATATETTSTVTVTAKTAGYAGNFSVSLAPTDVFFQSLEVVTISQTAAGSGPGYVNTITITAAGSGYQSQTPVTFSGGGGSGAFAVANTTVATAASSYQPAWGAAPGWDMATGLGSVNANNMVTNCAWVIPPGTPGLYCPTTSGSLPGPNVTFYWVGYPGATNYWLDLGSTAFGNNYMQTGPLPSTQTFVTANGLPQNGSTVYATWWYEVGGSWSNIQFTYNSYGSGSTVGVITSPAPSSTLTGSSVAFSWSAGSASTAYEIDAGSTPGGNNYFQSGNLGNVLTKTVTGLPTNGSQVLRNPLLVCEPWCTVAQQRLHLHGLQSDGGWCDVNVTESVRFNTNQQ